MSTTPKERPILFSAPMVRAILAGEKTQTRRIMKAPCQELAERDDGTLWPWSEHLDKADDFWHPCPYGQVGDRLWVRETWGYRLSATIPRGDHYVWGHTIEYAADGARKVFESPDMDFSGLPRQRPQRESEEPCSYQEYLTAYWRANRPSIHMPRWASRILLEIIGVRVERLQDISEEDAKHEGAWPDESIVAKTADYFQRDVFSVHPSLAFRMLWEGINGAGSWEANPWVWVVEFRRIV